MVNKYSKNNVKNIANSPSPRVLLNVCTHGNEQVGLKVADYFKDVKPLCGTLIINIANERASKANKRFISHDLNRVFPGRKDGSYEERLAYKMKPFIDAFDIVIDIHSTETGEASSLIITDYTRAMRPLLLVISPKRVIYMNTKKTNALMSSAKMGVAFEYGKDESKKTLLETTIGVKRVLRYYGILKANSINTKNQKKKIEFYEVDSSVAKPDGFIVASSIKNFSLVKKGALLGYNPKNNEKIFAKKSFYPFLFGKNSYKTTFGFSAKKRKL